MVKKIINRLNEGRIKKWMAIYTSTAVTIIYLMSTFSSRYNFPPEIFNLTLAVLIFGFVILLIFVLNHPGPERRKFRKTEIALYSIFTILLFLSVIKILNFKEVQTFTPAINSIAVLPFNNFSGSKEDEYFSDGVTEDILTQLAKIGQLKVVSRTSVMKYKNTTKNIKEIAGELGVKNILEGSVRRYGDKVRIVAQLIDAQHDNHLWAQTYDREIKDIFKIQSDVAKKITGQLKIKLSPSEEKKITTLRTNNIEAYTFYLKGKDFYYRYNATDNDEAIKLFKKAISADSNYAEAYAGLANAYAQRYGIFDLGKQWLDTARVLCLKAIKLNPDIAEPYKALGVVSFYSDKFQDAINYYQKAIDFNPNLVPAMTNIGSIYWLKGNYPEALKWINKSISIERKRSTNYRFLGLIYEGLDDFDKAEKNLLKVLELQPNLSFVVSDLTKLYLSYNQIEKCRKFLLDNYKKKPKDYRVLSSLGDFGFYTGDYNKAEEYYQKLIDLTSIDYALSTEFALVIKEKNPKKSKQYFDRILKEDLAAFESGSEDFNYSYDLARIYSVRNKTQKALYYFARAVSDGFRYYKLIELDPMFDNIRNEGAYKMRIDWIKKEIKEMRDKIENQ